MNPCTVSGIYSSRARGATASGHLRLCVEGTSKKQEGLQTQTPLWLHQRSTGLLTTNRNARVIVEDVGEVSPFFRWCLEKGCFLPRSPRKSIDRCSIGPGSYCYPNGPGLLDAGQSWPGVLDPTGLGQQGPKVGNDAFVGVHHDSRGRQGSGGGPTPPAKGESGRRYGSQ